ncbi:NUDIX domain-containing protein [Streptomyces sp. NPDC101490]|uniref:NUDIX domain-containing protein n=1 Tax=Streptomyces sp. NPDC101490 TaxID=3366143 RepID=UPI0037F625D4
MDNDAALRPLPLPPAEFAATLPQLTAYGCYFIRDHQGWPIQLHSVFTGTGWQWPGGNMDPGEDPLQTARREAREELGFDLPASPRLLAVFYSHPRGGWPTPKVGFCFDGGLLTPAQQDAIRLDPEEHSHWEAHPMNEWKNRVSPFVYARLAATEEAARTGTTPLLVRDGGTP